VRPHRRDLIVKDRKLIRWFAAHQGPDFAAAVLLGGVALWLVRNHGISVLDEAIRRTLYQTLAGLSATLFGLTMTTISVLASNIDKPIGGSPDGLPPRLVRGLTRPMFGLLRALGAMVLISLTLLVLDGSAKKAHWVAQPVILGCMLVIVARVTRVLVLLSNLLKSRTIGKTK